MNPVLTTRSCVAVGCIFILGSCINVAIIDAANDPANQKPTQPAIAPPTTPVSRVLCDPPPELILDPPPSASNEIIAALRTDVDRGISLLGDYIRELKMIIKNNSERATLALERVKNTCKKYP